MEKILERINRKNAVIGVIGLGYVGLPLALEKAKAGYHVIGFDIQEKRVDMVNQGINYIGDIIDEELADTVRRGGLKATADYADLADIDAVAICVPTPLDRYQQPDTSYVEASAKEIAKRLHPGMLVVLESTTYPGTTEEVVLPILEAGGLKVGEDFYLAFSPERVDPGNKVFNTKNTPKVVGGVTPACTQVAAALYRNVLEGEVVEVSSPAVAEMEKILENTFRNINIALANEMAVLCNKMGIDYWEVVEAAKSKPYGFMAFYPGPGLGGHCIPIDPYYLTWKAREYKYHTRLIELAGEINNYMPDFVVERSMQILNRYQKSMSGAKVLILGVAYKRDIDDMRESPVLEIIEKLEKCGAELWINDPHIPAFTVKDHHYESMELTADLLQSADLVLITTDHTDYNYDMIATHARVIFDTRNAMKNTKNIQGDYEKI
ncbi:nucleotide sugar dehydrogenase [Marininema halotolerans]|nr:nucleotide sugar dehydrogenase [Marininema halotolerans]